MGPPEMAAPGDNAAPWTSRSVGTQAQHHIFYFLIRYGGKRSAYLLLYFVALYYVLCRPSIRAKTAPYLSRRFRGRGGVGRLTDSYRMFVTFGKALIDRTAIGILGENHMKVTFPGRESLLDLLREGRGLLLVTAHVGCWQAAMASLVSLHVPVHLLLYREEGDIDMHYYEHSGTAPPFSIIDPKSPMGGVIEIIRALKCSEVVCLMGDRPLGSRKGMVAVDFLGDKAFFPFSAFKIASATGAPVVTLFSEKSGPDQYKLRMAQVIRVKPDLERADEELLPYVSQFVSALESYTQDNPYQFFNFFDMWKNDVPMSNDKGGNAR